MIIAGPPADHCDELVVLARKMKSDIYGQPELHHYDIDKEKKERGRNSLKVMRKLVCVKIFARCPAYASYNRLT